LFWSDISSSSSEDEFETSDEELGNCHHPIEVLQVHRLPCVPPLKRQKLDVPYRGQRQQRQKQKIDDLKKAHIAIEKLLASRKPNLLQGDMVCRYGGLGRSNVIFG